MALGLQRVLEFRAQLPGLNSVSAFKGSGFLA